MSYNTYNTNLKGFGGALGSLKSFTGGSTVTKIIEQFKKHSLHVGTVLLMLASFFFSVHAHRMADPVKNASLTLTKDQKKNRLDQSRNASIGGMVCDAVSACFVVYMIYKLR
jgi:hypothetical protein